jgi:hypothetical protein
MAIPTTGPVSMGMIRNELGMPTATNFSLTNASVGGVAGYPALNPFSPVRPPASTPCNISSWRGYSSVTIYVILAAINFQGPSGTGNLQIFVNGNQVLSVTNSTAPGQRIQVRTVTLNNNDIFYALLTPFTITPGLVFPAITINRFLSPIYGPTSPGSIFYTGVNTYFPERVAFGFPSAPLTPFSTANLTATIQPINLAAYELYAEL